ncbi:MAG: hypothetical protein JNM86_13115 [Phycisphaerae bacterium]|nr:hypothetical protein [Phycisphaerae bacterium]
MNFASRLLLGTFALVLTALPAPGALTFYGVPTVRWGLLGGAIGVGNCTIESFEDVDLAPGLQVLWESPAGNVGPVSVLPATFNPNTDDAFGTAFIGGNYDAARCLINVRTNDTKPYNQSADYGDVTFLFDPPVRYFGVSMHQSEFSPRLIVNGVDKGTVQSATGLAPGSGRIGYILIKADGADTISSVKFKNGVNPSGDGFTFDHLAFSTEANPTLIASGFKPSFWGIDDSSLGVAGASIEDFEDATLVPELLLAWDAPAGGVGPAAMLSNLFNPLTDDPFGNAFVGGTWDGARCLISARGNQSFTYTAGANWGDLILTFTPPQRRIGFSVQQMDQATRLVVNERDVGDFTSISNLDFNGQRQGYVRIDAKAGSRIATLRFANGRIGSFGDGIAIDHLAIGGGCFQDLNDDQQVDDADFLIFVIAYNLLDCADPSMPLDCPADFNNDNLVDDADFSVFIIGYNALLCP